ncbi:LOW QUALITY PROTEIN: uncharacterized protein LOC135473901 [Liolophura sinensis]|uniref:LOW QUALITY PROTEIN: uncharacterized protein LOC135473901 n=1 Tax=Liolophura sinensis TaxID=3198878 RepID=UPI0031588433
MAENGGNMENQLDQNDWEKIKIDLADKGYVVVHDVLTENECDQSIAQYRDWLSQFDVDEAPFHLHSLIQRYRIGHFEPSWRVRLKAKPVFAKLWKTEKLLSSFDAVAIGEPPEKSGSDERFARGDEKWLHLDQGKFRQGLHAYQGAVYLEETTDTDWVFRVLSGSHKHHQLFYDSHPAAGNKSKQDFYKLKDPEIQWYKEKGCELTKVPVPKGGMVLWDSRLVHDSCRPELGRPNADRWRFVVFVSMTPAVWASERDLNMRKTAYKRLFLTTHWSSQGANYFPEKNSDFPWKRIKTIESLPDIALSDDAKLLSGVIEYDFEDGRPNGDEYFPVWTIGEYAEEHEEPIQPIKHKKRSKPAKSGKKK